MNELTININTNLKTPIYEQIYEYIKDEIKANRITYGMKLPSARALANHLAISRSTVDMAYLQLMSEGYIESIPCKGYFVSEVALLYDINVSRNRTLTINSNSKKEEYIDFSPRGIDLVNFPYNTWRRITKNILSYDNSDLFKAGDQKGDQDFRNTISNYLFSSRGVYCNSEQIILGAGNEYLLFILNQLFGRKLNIAMENPTYLQAYKVFQSLGNKMITIDMDQQGLIVNDLQDTRADIVYVMPSHQYPLGTVMPIKRRVELLKWTIEKPDRYIIEDDYDSEYRYKGKPVPALKSLDHGENVIYLGTFSKSISPSIRMSYMVLPEKLLEVYNKNLNFYSSTVSMIDQAIVNEFIVKGHYERHLNKMRSIYKRKHDLIINELKNFTIEHRILGEHSGLHILLELEIEKKEKDILEEIKNRGVKVYGLSDFYINPPKTNCRPTIILGYANLSEEEIKKGIHVIKKTIMGQS